MKNIVRFLLRCAFRVMKVRVSFQVKEEGEWPSKGIYISNHVSWLDPVILFAFLPNNPVFLLHAKLYRNKWIRFFMHYADKREFSYINVADTKDVIEIINKDRYCLMFPEGCMTDNGDMMKIYEAPAVVADRTGAPFIPIWISGAEYSRFSETGDNLPHRPFPKIKIKVGAPKFIEINDELKKNRDYLRDVTYHLLNKMRFQMNFKSNITLFKNFVRITRIYGKEGWFKRREFLEDINRQPQTYKDVLLKSYVLGQKFAQITEKGENVGVILPNAVATVVSFFGLSAYARVPVMVNFSLGAPVVLTMCKTACVKRVITSKAFIMKAKLEDVIEALKTEHIKITYLEDLAKTIKLSEKLRGLWYYKIKKIPVEQKSSDPAVILFTSGSEGTPKGVVLSHSNIIANVNQTRCFEQLNTRDLLFNSLPMFHSFGLCVGTFFGIFSGARLFLFPSPLLYRTITELLYELKVTVMAATDTFYKVYANISHPHDFKNVRLCYAGAEAVKQETRDLVAERLGVRLMEAYGTTECSPVLCGNNTLFNKFGTLGKLPPAIDYRLEPVEGIKEGGEFVVRGPNIMKGYLYADNPGVLVPVKDGWYHTGDVVVVDDLGFVKIVDRVKRFAKIAGEMISLTAVENIAVEIWGTDEFRCGAIAIPSDKKGEQIVMVTNNKDATRAKFAEKVRSKGLSELYIPVEFMYKDELPLFATGKADNITLKKWVLKEKGLA